MHRCFIAGITRSISFTINVITKGCGFLFHLEREVNIVYTYMQNWINNHKKRSVAGGNKTTMLAGLAYNVFSKEFHQQKTNGKLILTVNFDF